MKTDTADVTGAFVATDPLKEAEQLLRLIDEGRFDDLSAWLAAAQNEARVSALLEVLGSREEPEELRAAG